MMKGLPGGDKIQGRSCSSDHPLFFLCVSTYLLVCKSECVYMPAVLHPFEPSHVNDTRLQGILSLFVLLPPQGPPLAPISFH